jgi:hypothetical protein
MFMLASHPLRYWSKPSVCAPTIGTSFASVLSKSSTETGEKIDCTDTRRHSSVSCICMQYSVLNSSILFQIRRALAG